MSETILEMHNITKTFPGVKALDNVNLTVQEGEIHALVGENGAGKSTLMKVLSGIYPAGDYDGDIYFHSEKCRFKEITDSEALGIVIIHQELALIPFLSIAENIFLGNEQARHGVIDWHHTHMKAKQLMDTVGLQESPDVLVTNIGVGKQQLVEIAKALSKKVKLLILDEPTATLNEKDSEKLLKLLLQFKGQGISSILISHKLNEVEQVADAITILRDGATIETLDCKNGDISEDQIIFGMVGRDMTHRYPKRDITPGREIFEIEAWTVHHPLHPDRKVVDNVSLNIREGEVLGIAGLMGSGRTELAMSIFGHSYGQDISGTVKKVGKPIDISTVERAISNGLAYVTEDRKTYGLILDQDIKNNITLTNLKSVTRGLVIDQNQEILHCRGFKESLNIKCSSILQKTLNLSGGNQQKVVLSKWLFAQPDILILDEPTRGIDVGAKYEIYTIINKLATEGKSIIVISSELPELLGICDRIYVMNEGRIVGELAGADASQEKIMKCIMQQIEERMYVTG
jgi:putative multiple sugar transport system ATP-binding protein